MYHYSEKVEDMIHTSIFILNTYISNICIGIKIKEKTNGINLIIWFVLKYKVIERYQINILRENF